MIAFAGLSHLGLVSAAAAAAKGFDVIGFDPDAVVVAEIVAGRLPVVEPGLPELVAGNAARIVFTADASRLGDCQLIYIAVDVPVGDDGAVDISPVERLLDTVSAAGAPDAVVVILSQVSPGFTRQRLPRLRAAGKRLFYQVETLIFGRAVERALHPERIIVGCEEPTVPLPRCLAEYLTAFTSPILPMCLESAELAKIAINMFLASTLTTTNVLAEMCEAIGADWDEIVPSLRLDKRIGPHAYLKPGLGIGGTNLLRDMVTIRTIAEERGTDAGPVDAWLKNSRWRRDWALRAVHREVLCRTPAATVAVWGVAYKENTASTRNSPGAELVTALKGYRRQVYDPAATLALPGDCDVIQSSGPIEACRGADVLLVMTPWPELAGIDPATIRAAMRGRTVIDPFGLLPAGPVAAAGLTHFRQGTACH